MDDKYFSRAACWHRLKDQLVVHDSFSPSAPRMITMEPWHEIAFLAADGQHTVGEFVQHMAGQFHHGEPEGLREHIHNVILELAAEHILRVHDHAEPLPSYFAEEYFEKDADMRRQQMQADGLID